MPYRCAACGRAFSDEAAVLNELACFRKCGGSLEPLPTLDGIDGIDAARLPYPVAQAAARLRAALDRSTDPCRALFLLRDAFETAVKYLGSVLLVEYLRGPVRTPALDATLLEK